MPESLATESGSVTPVIVVEDTESPRISAFAISFLGSTMLLLFITICYVTYALWPIPIAPTDGDTRFYSKAPEWKTESVLFGTPVTLSSEQRLLILVLLSGALGSFIHAATSFSNYVGDGKIDRKWIWWYILRPFIGMGVALIFYLVFRAGLFAGTDIALLNIYGVLTLSALSGLFTDRATLKLEEVFQSLFKPRDERSDKLKDTNRSEFDNPSAKS